MKQAVPNWVVWVAMLALGSAVSPAQGAVWTNVVDGTVVTGRWHDAANWDPGVPVAGENANLTSTLYSYVVEHDEVTTTYTNATLAMGNSGGNTVTLNVITNMEGDADYGNTSGRFTLNLGSGAIVNVRPGASMRFNVPITSSDMMYGTLNVFGECYWHNPSGASGDARSQLTVYDGGALETLLGSGSQQALTFGAGSAALIEEGGSWTHDGRELYLANGASVTVRGAFVMAAARNLHIGAESGSTPEVRVETNGTFTVSSSAVSLSVGRPTGATGTQGLFVLQGGTVVNNVILCVGHGRDGNKNVDILGTVHLNAGSWFNNDKVFLGGYSIGTDPTSPEGDDYKQVANVTQSDGDFVANSDVYLARGPATTTLTLSGGRFAATNAAGTATLYVGSSVVQSDTSDVLYGRAIANLDGGELFADSLVAANGAPSGSSSPTDGGYSVINFNAGRLATRGTTLDTGVALTVGDGVQSATLDLLAGTHTLPDGLVINTNATLSAGGSGAIGSASIDGNVTLREDAHLAWDFNATTQDSVAVDGTVALPSSVTVELTSLDASTPAAIPLLTATGGFTGSPSGWPKVKVGGVFYGAVIEGNTLQMVPPAGTLVTIQ